MSVFDAVPFGALERAWRAILVGLVVLLASAGMQAEAFAAPADLDPAFGAGGTISHSITSGNDELRAIAIQPDGKIVAVGKSIVANRDFAVMRLNNDGSLDTTFSGDGLLTLDVVGGRHDDVYDVAIQPDGKIVAAGSSMFGSSGTMFAAVRLNSDGSYDNSFDTDGRAYVWFGFGTTDQQVANALQNNGKIVIAGQYYQDSPPVQDFFVSQYDSNGVLDPGFDGDGILTKALSPNGDHAQAVAVQSDGKIIAGGLVDDGIDYEFGLMRLQGELPYVAPAPVLAQSPVAAISSPPSGKVESRKLRSFAGTAGPAGSVAKVEIAVRRVDRAALKRGKCLWLRGAKGAFIKMKAIRKKCAKRKFLTASGTDKWTYRLKKKLAKGKYELYVRVTLTTGETQTSFSKSAGNLMPFKIT